MRKSLKESFIKILLVSTMASTSIVMSGCATSVAQPMPTPAQLSSPEPIEGNSGNYMSPYTSDEVVAEWVDNALKAGAGAQLGGSIGSVAGSLAADQLLGNFGIFGQMLGKAAGEKLGRAAALKSAGGMEFIRETSDLSFNTWQDLCVYLYAEHSHRENYADVLAATQQIYTKMADGCVGAIRQSSASIN